MSLKELKLRQLLTDLINEKDVDVDLLHRSVTSVVNTKKFPCLHEIHHVDYWTALKCAVRRGLTEQVRCLLDCLTPDQRFAILRRKGPWWRSLLHLASSSNGRPEMISCILDSVPPNQQLQLLDIGDDDLETPLDCALQYNWEAVECLRQYRLIAEQRVRADQDERVLMEDMQRRIEALETALETEREINGTRIAIVEANNAELFATNARLYTGLRTVSEALRASEEERVDLVETVENLEERVDDLESTCARQACRLGDVEEDVDYLIPAGVEAADG